MDAWLKEHGPTLKPPVANKLLFGGDLKVMVVGGPNQRRDYHLQEGEEFFAQLEGTLTLKTIEQGRSATSGCTGGDCFLLPSRVPHSPQREAASLGLVFERSHVEGEMDGMLWFDEGRDLSGRCDLDEIAYEAYFFCSDLGKDLKPVIEDYGRWKDSGEPPRRVAAPPLVPDDVVPLDVPQPLQPRLDGLQPSSTMLLHRGEEVIVEARVGVRCLRAADRHRLPTLSAIAAQAHAGPKKLATGGSPFEVFVWQRGLLARRRRRRGADVGGGRLLPPAEGDAVRVGPRGRRDVECCERVYVITRTLDSSPRGAPFARRRASAARPRTTISSTSARSSVRKSSMARSCAVRALSNASAETGGFGVSASTSGSSGGFVNDRLVGGARRHESLPAQTTWDFGRATWLLERDRGAGLARRRTRAAQRAESMVWSGYGRTASSPVRLDVLCCSRRACTLQRGRI